MSQVRASDPESLLNASRDAETAAARVDVKLAQFEAADRDTAYKLRKIGWELS
ncbi:hypothetical protein [Mycobacterium sp. E802]|uniref:hypothetical protein n=1 Tax=Mycobacterium sp. E802 TaxID=1834152 RepID=UPI0018D3E77C|nr:hypothetical protein [Mycobacterium sp. E802]